MSERIYFQHGSLSKYHGWLKPGAGWQAGVPAPYMFGRGWRKFRKHTYHGEPRK